MTPQDATVFVIDDDEAVRDSLRGTFRAAGVEVRAFGSADEFLKAHESGALDRIRIDPTHVVGSINPVNPVYIHSVEQIHAVDRIAVGDSNLPRSALGCIVVDVRMPGMDGFELLAEVTKRDIDMPVIMITGHGDATAEQRAMKAGAVAFFHKPIDDQALLDAVEKTIAQNIDGQRIRTRRNDDR